MSLIDRAATFRGRIISHCVNKSISGLPQWVVQLVATEIYDSEEQVWVDWSEYDVNEITAYLVLFSGDKKEILNSQQAKKITGWDGLSYFLPQGLSNLDLSKTGIQFRVEENTFKNKTTLQVAWIDEYGAEPGRTVRELNPEEMKALDAQYANLLKQSGKKANPAKPKSPGKVTVKGVKPTQPKGPVKKKVRDPLGPPEILISDQNKSKPDLPVPKKPGPPSDSALPIGHCTKDEAWEIVYDLKAKEVSDEKIATIWRGALKEVAPGVEQENVTDEQWFLVKQRVLKETAVF